LVEELVIVQLDRHCRVISR